MVRRTGSAHERRCEQERRNIEREGGRPGRDPAGCAAADRPPRHAARGGVRPLDAAGPPPARRACGPRIPGRRRPAVLQKRARTARALGDAAGNAAFALLLPARRGHRRAAHRRGRAPAPAGPRQSRRGRTRGGGLSRNAARDRGRPCARLALRHRYGAAGLDRGGRRDTARRGQPGDQRDLAPPLRRGARNPAPRGGRRPGGGAGPAGADESAGDPRAACRRGRPRLRQCPAGRAGRRQPGSQAPGPRPGGSAPPARTGRRYRDTRRFRHPPPARLCAAGGCRRGTGRHGGAPRKLGGGAGAHHWPARPETPHRNGVGPAAGGGRSGRAGNGDGESRYQCARCHAAGWDTHPGRCGRRGDGARRPAPGGPAPGPLRPAFGRGHRHRHGRRNAGARGGAILHHQAGRRGHGTWPRHGPRIRPAGRGRLRHRQRARPRDHGHPLAACRTRRAGLRAAHRPPSRVGPLDAAFLPLRLAAEKTHAHMPGADHAWIPTGCSTCCHLSRGC